MMMALPLIRPGRFHYGAAQLRAMGHFGAFRDLLSGLAGRGLIMLVVPPHAISFTRGSLARDGAPIRRRRLRASMPLGSYE